MTAADADHSKPAADKRTATLTARAALLGVQLTRSQAGGWIVARWSLAKELSDDEIEEWLQRLEGRRGVT